MISRTGRLIRWGAPRPSSSLAGKGARRLWYPLAARGVNLDTERVDSQSQCPQAEPPMRCLLIASATMEWEGIAGNVRRTVYLEL